MKPFTFSSTSFLVITFKEDYLREQAVKEKEEKTVRQRRSVESGARVEELSLRIRTRQDGLLLLAEDAANNYTVLEVRTSVDQKRLCTHRSKLNFASVLVRMQVELSVFVVK